MKNFEKELPDFYREVYHIDARDAKTGGILTLFSFVLTVIPLVVFAWIAGFPACMDQIEWGTHNLIRAGGTIVAMIAYLVLHELVHGIAYRCLTHEKLTFGMSWSCAFCGVPHIYVSRRTALISLCAPLTVFSVLFLGLAAAVYSTDLLLFLLIGLLFSIHFGGCIGDMYMIYLLLFRYRQENLLMRDTGPEQFLYLPETEKEKV